MWRREKKRRRGEEKKKHEMKYKTLSLYQEKINDFGLERNTPILEALWFSGLRDLNNLGHWITMKISLHYFILVGQVEGILTLHLHLFENYLMKDKSWKSKWA